VDTTDEKGQPNKFDYEASLDGKPSKVTGSTAIDELSLKRVNDHTIDATGKKSGKVVYTDKRTVSADGKTYTISRAGTSPEVKKNHSTIVFDKQ
jgi:hypothetical protein